MNDWEPWLVATAALHLGFQLTVTAVVYPALADVPPADWSAAHAAHSRRISYVVAAAYLPLLGVGLWALVDGPVDVGLVVAAVGAAVSFLTTAAVAAPTHGRLGSGRTDALVARLLVADRVRLLGAVVCLAGALVAVLAG
ncbi:hypothetical protein [Nocardioides marmoribigeumensis]|uniref:DUF1772 domain-containing protein n=1 Tax=Nocardioides marmoribigeumensis TaxID=433649 RepID=A0ABU2BZT9_9ACTN|nr:hypothetical protein [Nocardioides marmoribigeumensis]MDR7363889.1 hypothetical protein [Nocardioides marmoribigeumensis]